ITGVRGSSAHAWTAIRRLAAARDRADGPAPRATPSSRSARMSVNVSTVIQRANVHEIADLVRRSQAEGCDGHNLQPINLQHGRFHEGRVQRRDDAAAIAALWPAHEQSAALDRLFEFLVAHRD